MSTIDARAAQPQSLIFLLLLFRQTIGKAESLPLGKGRSLPRGVGVTRIARNYLSTLVGEVSHHAVRSACFAQFAGQWTGILRSKPGIPGQASFDPGRPGGKGR